MHANTSGHPISRRTFVAGAGALAGMAALASCGEGENAVPEATPTAQPTEGSGSESPAGSGGEAIAKVSDIPVGGAVSAEDAAGDPIILAQPSAGEVVAFSAICTHRGCTVAPEDKILKCPCHGSTFDLSTGENTGGPAPSPLAKVDVVVEGDEVRQS